MKTKVMALMLALAMIPVVGCANKYHRAVQAAKDLADAVSTAQSVAHTAHAQGLTSNEEDTAVQQVIQVTARDGAVLTESIVNFKGVKGVAPSLKAVLADTDLLLDSGTLPVKNPQAQAEIKASVLSIRALVDIIAAAAD